MDNDETCKSCSDVYSGDEIVISGISGRFPDSENVKHLQENLFNKINLVRSDHCRWKTDYPDLPRHMGTITNIEKFDADFFDVDFEQAHTLNPMVRMLLEHTYEAIVDAGINPKQLRGRNTAVITGITIIESQEKFLYQNLEIGGLGILGCSKSTMANMISHWLDLKGPSYAIDNACSTSFYAVALGYYNIMSGQCEDAIIATAHICQNPLVTMQFICLGVLSPNGRCRPFDASSNGYIRSEGVSVIYLQKVKNAKRIYATCKHIKLNNDGYKEEGITFPSTHVQSILLKEFYEECGLSPSCLDYVETHGTGTKAGDPSEVNALYNILCKDRKTPLMIGSVKSNLGHTEATSGMIQIAKAIIAFETGTVPPNINFTSPRNDAEALANGSIRVVTEALPLKNGYIGMNCYGFGGSNAHMLLMWNLKKKINKDAPIDDLPRLVTLSGRTEESVNSFMNDIASHPIDVEYIRLVHDIHADSIDGHPWRGYTILDAIQKNPLKEIQNYKSVKAPVWFIFSALDSQWPGMGRDLLRFHTFANAVRMCDVILKPYDINITDILMRTDNLIYENGLHSFIAIVAIQIGLVDLLTSLKIIPDNMIGHSAGELGCAYADKCLTLEQTILSAYFIGLGCVEENVTRGIMASANLDFERLKHICPTDIEIACRNSQNNNVIGGPTESMQEFIKHLQANDIYVKEIDCNNILYHSQYIAPVENQILLKLNKVIQKPKERSSKWISTSVPCTKWSSAIAKLSSASYHTHSISNIVLFEQAAHLIPNNAVTIEIGPDSVLQHILKESLNSSVKNITLSNRNSQNVDAVLEGIGKLYNCGLQPLISNLYPPVEFPVSRGTPMISPSIKWDHSKDWFVPTDEKPKPIKCRERLIEISLQMDDYKYMAGHVIDGRNLLPTTCYLMLVWETIGILEGERNTTIPIVFRDIRFIRATTLPKNDTIELIIMILKDSGKFAVIEGNSVVVTGAVYATSNPKEEMIQNNVLSEDVDEEEYLTSQDIYKEFRLRGYGYRDLFRGLKSASASCRKGHAAWLGNWVTFMDSMLQMYILGKDTRDLHVPMSIQKLVIDPALHLQMIQNVTTAEDKQLPIRLYKNIDVIRSGGIEIRGFAFTIMSRQKPTQDPVIQEHKFIAHQDYAKISLEEAIRISAQLAVEDHQVVKVKGIELVEDTDDVQLKDLSSVLLLEAVANMPVIHANFTLITPPNRFNPENLPQHIRIANFRNPSVADDNVLIATGFNLLSKGQNSIKRLLPFLKEGGYLLTREKYHITDREKYLKEYDLNVILEKHTDNEMIVLLKKNVLVNRRNVVYINNEEFGWLENLKRLVNKFGCDKNSRIVIVGEGDFDCGLLGFIKCLKTESGGEYVRSILIQDDMAPKFSLQDPFYMRQLQKDMVCNVLRPNKTWGTYRHLRLPHPEAKPVPTAYVRQTISGDLGTFCWTENNLSIDSHSDNLVSVIYSSINFKDVLLATGKLALNTIDRRRLQCMFLGLEYVGFDGNGQRVMGMCKEKCIANVVVKYEYFCWKIPDAWTFEEAATVPCVYSTNYYALYILGKMKRGDKILIHCGTSCIGQSAIHLALNEGCEVFTTVGNIEKRIFLKTNFPAIPDDHIGNSRDTSFEQLILQRTHGRGVDIVLNSLIEEKLIASVRCLAKNGRFLEIGKFDICSINPLIMSAFQKGISFRNCNLNALFESNHKHASLLSKLMSDGLKNGVIKPVQAKVFWKTEIEAAFRYMAAGKHIGKIILKIQEEDKSMNAPILAHRRYYCFSDKTYIILGGLGGFGLELSDWLILRGAKNIVLTSRTGIKNGYQRMKINLWKSYGVNVVIVNNLNIANPNDCAYLLQTAEKQGSVDAIFNLALVLNDNVLKNQTIESFEESFISKAWATQALDKQSRKICTKLRYFVVFSSLSSGIGNPGQTNYGMTNSVMERVCERRREEGLPGLAIQWGPIDDVGIMADIENDKQYYIPGFLHQNISSCLNELEKFLLQDQPIVSSIVLAKKELTSPKFSNMVETVVNIMGIKDMKMVSQRVSLSELGMDSILGVKIKQILERNFDIFLSAQEIRNLTFANLIAMSNESVSRNDRSATTITDEGNMSMFLDCLKDEDFISEICLDLSTKQGKNHVFFLPGIDGCATRFKHLASSIKFSATSLQYSTNNIDFASTISQMTDSLLNAMLPKLKDGKQFVLVGFFFGSILAIELITRLEAMNFKGRLILIDGAPDYMHMIAKRFLSYSSKTELEIHLMIYIMQMYDIEIKEQVLVELKKCKTWDERFNTFAEHFLAVYAFLSLTNLKTLYTTIYKHATIMKEYNISTSLRISSPVILLKPTFLYLPDIEEDYGLHKIANIVEVHCVEGKQATLLKSKQLIAAINEEVIQC